MDVLGIKNPSFDIRVEENLDLEHKIKMLDIMVTLLQTISSIHDRGLVHSDIKPENIILEPKTNELLLIDFGESDTNGTIHVNEQGEPTPIGTPYYMDLHATEGTSRPQSDYHAFVILGHQLLTGYLPGNIGRAKMPMAAMLAGMQFKDKCTEILNAHYKTPEAKAQAPIFECLLNDLVSKIDDLPTNPKLRENVVEKLNHIKSNLEGKLKLEHILKNLVSKAMNNTEQTKELISKLEGIQSELKSN